VKTTKQAALKQKYSQTLTEANLTLRLRDQGSQRDESEAKRYNEHRFKML